MANEKDLIAVKKYTYQDYLALPEEAGHRFEILDGGLVKEPSTRRKDRLRKMQIYQRAKIKHYWLVNPEEKTLECFALRNDLYAIVASGMDDEVVTHPDFAGLSINLKVLWL